MHQHLIFSDNNIHFYAHVQMHKFNLIHSQYQSQVGQLMQNQPRQTYTRSASTGSNWIYLTQPMKYFKHIFISQTAISVLYTLNQQLYGYKCPRKNDTTKRSLLFSPLVRSTLNIHVLGIWFLFLEMILLICAYNFEVYYRDTVSST